jgi:hypothetical protein
VVVVVVCCANSDPLPSVVFDEILEIPQTRSAPCRGLAPDVCISKNGLGK